MIVNVSEQILTVTDGQVNRQVSITELETEQLFMILSLIGSETIGAFDGTEEKIKEHLQTKLRNLHYEI